MNKLATVIFMLACIAFGVVGGYLAAFSNDTVEKRSSAVTEKTLLEYVNEVRAQHNVAPLREDSALNQTAQMKAGDLADRNYFEHTTPEGVPFYFIMLQTRPNLQLYGENLAECYPNNPDTIEAWKQSEGHFKNIVDPRYTIFGSSSVWDADKHCMIIVNHFGRE